MSYDSQLLFVWPALVTAFLLLLSLELQLPHSYRETRTPVPQENEVDMIRTTMKLGKVGLRTDWGNSSCIGRINVEN